MRVGRIAADDEDHVGFVEKIEVLRAGRSAECLVEAVAPAALPKSMFGKSA